MSSPPLGKRESEDVAAWGVGCLVASVAVTGVLIFVLILALALEIPTWAQVSIGVGLVAGGAFLAWLVAAALRASRAHPRGPRPIEPGD